MTSIDTYRAALARQASQASREAQRRPSFSENCSSPMIAIPW